MWWDNKGCWGSIMVEDEKFVIVKRVKKEEGGKKEVNFIDEFLVSLLVKDLNIVLWGFIDDEIYCIK